MSGKLALPIFFAVTFLGAMLLGPFLFFALEAMLPGAVPFHRAMDRALLIAAVIAIVLCRDRFRLRKLWPWTREGGLQLLLGYFIAAVSIQAMLAAYLALAGFTSAHLNAGHVAVRVAMALVAALIAPPLEETLFRGFLQGELVRGLGWRAGWVLTAAIFMLAHFLKIPVELDRQPVQWWSGTTALGAAFTNFAHGLARPDNLGKAINLFTLGLILGGVALRTGSLWLNAGLHSGWIFGLLLFTGLTHPVEPPRYDWAGGDILSSVTTTVGLVLTGLWLWRFYRHPSIRPETAPESSSGSGAAAP